ncbi:MAG: tetratricopeptide repeat protein [Cytophagales bacterium]
MNVDEIYQKATQLIEAKKLEEAEGVLNQILQLEKQHFGALYSLLQLNYKKKDYKTAFDISAFALQHYPQSDALLYMHGLLHSKANQWTEAQVLWRKCIDVNPQHERALFQLGRFHKLKEEFAIAEAYFRKALVLAPDEFSTLNNLANTIQSLGQNEEAKVLLLKATTSNPENATLHYNLANIYLKLEHNEEAYISVNKSLEIEPNYADAHVLFGQLCWNKIQISKAKTAFSKALEISPNHAEAAYKLASLLRANGEVDKALLLLQKIVAHSPKDAKSIAQIGSILQHKGGINESVDFFRKAVEIEPKNAEFQFNLAQILDIKKDFAPALKHYDLSASLLPSELHVSFFHRQLLRLKMCDWAHYESTVSEMIRRVDEYSSDDSDKFALPSLTLNYFPIPQEYHLKIAQKNARLISKGVEPWINDFEAYKKESQFSKNSNKIRIGYVSPDFRDHAVGLILKDFFGLHNKEAFEIYAYALTASGDEYYENYRSTASVFRDISGFSILESAKQIYVDEIDILVDLAGNTTFSKPGIFALKPCHIQLHYMGYLDTLGADFLPYIIADEVVINDEMKPFYSEKIINLLHYCFLSDLPKSTKIVTRKDCNLPENKFVFACFNYTQKFSPDWFETCMEILKKCPDSVFWIFNNDSEIVEQNLQKEAERHGLESARLIFASSVPFDEHIARCSSADLFLDTFNYGAGLTAWAALSGGLPVLSFKGSTFLSRMTSSILQSLDLLEFICDNKTEYINKAMDFYSKGSEKLKDNLVDKITKVAGQNATLLAELENKYRLLKAK